VIAETWSSDELQDAEVLAELEGWGQQKRLVARLCAEVHNAVTNAVYATQGTKDTKPPKPLSESLFLPRRVRVRRKVAKTEEQKQQAVLTHQQKTSQLLSSLAGY